MAWKRTTKPHAWFPRRGAICLFHLDKERPALVISNDALNRFSVDVCVVPLSTVEHKQFSLRPKLTAGTGGIQRDSWLKCDQPTTLAKDSAVYPPVGFLSGESMSIVEAALRKALHLE
jgi:mRNA interferase MazF